MYPIYVSVPLLFRMAESHYLHRQWHSSDDFFFFFFFNYVLLWSHKLSFNLLFGTSRTFCIFAYQIHSHYVVISDGKVSLACCYDMMTFVSGAVSVLLSSSGETCLHQGAVWPPGWLTSSQPQWGLNYLCSGRNKLELKLSRCWIRTKLCMWRCYSFKTQTALQHKFKVREDGRAPRTYALAFWLPLRLCWCSLLLVSCIWRGAEGLKRGWTPRPFSTFPSRETPLFVTPHLFLSYIPRNQKVTLQEWPSLKEVDSNPRLHGHPMTQHFWLLCLQKLLTDSPVAKYNLLFIVILIVYILSFPWGSANANSNV